MRHAFRANLLAALVISTVPASAAGKRYIVGFKPGMGPAARAEALKTLGGKTLAAIKSNGNTADEYEAFVVELPEGKAPSAPAPTAARKTFRLDVFAEEPATNMGLGSDSLIIEEDYKVKWIEQAKAVSFAGTPLPTLGAVLGGLKPFKPQNLFAMVQGELTWGIKRVKAPAAWDVTEGQGVTDGKRVTVAVIDTGIKSGHPDLAGQVVGGYNAIEDTEKDGSWEDDNGHGTHVAGTIGAKRDGRGVVGVAPKVKLYGVKVLDSEGSGTLSDVIKGVIWAANNDMQVANMSLGSPSPSEMLHRAVRYAAARSVVVVAAAGNSGAAVGYPGAYPETIAVAAMDWEDKITDFSSRGDAVDFIAPGLFVVSTWLNNNTVSLSGTSMAAPHVAGLAALAVAKGARGIGGPDGVMAALKKASKTVGLTKQEEGFGLIDAGKLVE